MGRGEYETVISPDEYQNVNPYSGAAFSLGNRAMNEGRGFMGQGSTMLNDTNFNRQFLSGAGFNQGAADPNAFMNAYLGYSPAIQSQVMGQTSPLARQQAAYTGGLMDDAIAKAATEFSNLGSLNSGAALNSAARGAGAEAARAGVQLSTLQNQLAGNLLGQGMAGFGSSYGQAQDIGTRLAMQDVANRLSAGRTLMGTGAGMYGQGLGATSALGAPNFAAPTKEYVPSPGEQFGGFLATLGGEALGSLAGTGMSDVGRSK